jgi:hypothetical protein
VTQIIGRDPESSNPLLLLARALTEQTEVLKVIAENTKKEDRHVYGIDEVGEGSFMSYCFACSENLGRYVHPCQDEKKAPPGVPPSTFSVGRIGMPIAGPDILSGD